MSDNQKQIIEDGKTPSVPQAFLATHGVDGGRRRFTAAGIAASGAVLTLASRPVLGQGLCAGANIGMTVSGWMSCNTSKNHTNTSITGLSPGYWKNHLLDWPRLGPSPTMKFMDLFPKYTGVLRTKVACQTPTGVVVRYPLLSDVLSAQVYNNEFGRSLVCAYLNALANAAANLPQNPTAADVILMSKKQFRPTPTAPYWTETEICAFLGQTFR